MRRLELDDDAVETFNGRRVAVKVIAIDMGCKVAAATGGVQIADDCSDAICDFVTVPE